MDSREDEAEGTSQAGGSQAGYESQGSQVLDLTQDDDGAAAPSRKKASGKDAGPAPTGPVPLTLAPNCGKEGKATLLVELDSRAGGFGNDTGAIGRASFPRVDGRRAFRLDLRGQEYDARLRPCATMLVVNVSNAAEAKVECVLSEYATLSHARDAMGDDAIVSTGALDDERHANDADVNAKARKRKGDDDDGAKKKKKKSAAASDSEGAPSDAEVTVPKKKRGPVAKRPAGRGRGRGRGRGTKK